MTNNRTNVLRALKVLKKHYSDTLLLEIEYSKILDLIGEKFINRWLKEKREYRKNENLRAN